MRRIKKFGITFGFIFLGSVFCFISFIAGAGEAKAGILTFDFTYTSDETVKVGNLGDTILFLGTLKNTGTEADSYAILMSVNSPTPPEWVVLLCSGGSCHTAGVTEDTVYLLADQEDFLGTEIETYDTCGDASVTITATSRGNPGLSKSVTFLLGVHTGCVPMTDKWGLLILISLLFLTGLYLIRRRLRLATTG
jgi:hypothetical protein